MQRNPIRRKISEDVAQTIYGSCKDNLKCYYFVLTKGANVAGWSQGDSLEEKGLGKTNKDINATNLIWSFFEAHPLP